VKISAESREKLLYAIKLQERMYDLSFGEVTLGDVLKIADLQTEVFKAQTTFMSEIVSTLKEEEQGDGTR